MTPTPQHRSSSGVPTGVPTADRPVTLLVALKGVAMDEGSIVVFSGVSFVPESLLKIAVAVDHRIARDLVEALSRGLDLYVEVEPWQIVAVWS